MLLIYKAISELAIFTIIFWHISFFLNGALDGYDRGRGSGRWEWAGTCWSLLHAAAVVAQDFALLAQVLWVLLALVRDVQAVRLLQRSL